MNSRNLFNHPRTVGLPWKLQAGPGRELCNPAELFCGQERMETRMEKGGKR